MAKPTVVALLHPTRAGLLRGSKQTPGGGTVNFCSWNRLVEEMKQAGMVRDREDVTAIVVEDGGISIYLNLRSS